MRVYFANRDHKVSLIQSAHMLVKSMESKGSRRIKYANLKMLRNFLKTELVIFLDALVEVKQEAPCFSWRFTELC